MTAKALVYAENDLGVHKVYEESQAAHGYLVQAREQLAAKHAHKRDLVDRLTDREMVVASDERGKHPDMSQAGMDKHVKVAYNADGDIRTYRDQIRALLFEIDVLEQDISNIEYKIKIALARMNELGGYFNYLAVVKNHRPIPQT